MDGIQVQQEVDRLRELMDQGATRQLVRGYLVKAAGDFIAGSGLTRKERRKLARTVGHRMAKQTMEEE